MSREAKWTKFKEGRLTEMHSLIALVRTGWSVRDRAEGVGACAVMVDGDFVLEGKSHDQPHGDVRERWQPGDGAIAHKVHQRA